MSAGRASPPAGPAGGSGVRARLASRLVVAPDKFRGTATAAEVAGAISRAAHTARWATTELALADGGEGTLEALGGAPRHATVEGPLGDPVVAEWRYDGATAVIEAARASGFALVGGAGGNDPMAASSVGTGQLIAAAAAAGARRVVVGVGGVASTDGGLGAVVALAGGGRADGGPAQGAEGAGEGADLTGGSASSGLSQPSRARCLAGVELIVACDVRASFLEAAATFAPQKGANSAQVALLERRLARMAQAYLDTYGVDVRDIPGSGAAGGLAGGLAALGAALVPGFDLVAEAVGLAEHLDGAQLVVTGEGHLDRQSFGGKVVGGVVALAQAARVPVLVVAGRVDADAWPPPGGVGPITVVSLTECFGPERALADPVSLVQEVVGGFLAGPQAPDRRAR